MTALQTPFGTVAGRYPFLGSMSLLNCYVEVEKGEKAKYCVVPSEGLTSFASVTDTPSRGAIFLDDLSVAYTFHQDYGFKVQSDGTVTNIGVIPGDDNVEVTRNSSAIPQITVCSVNGLYCIASDAVTVIDDSDIPTGIVSVETLGEFTLYGHPDGRVFYSTQGDTTAVDAADFFTAEQSPDQLVKLKVDRGELLIFGTFTTEVWTFQGTNVDTPFVYKTLIQFGCLARDTVKTCSGTVMFAGQSAEGDKGVYRLIGYAAQKISTDEIDGLIERESDPSTLIAFTYGRQGHSFYVIKGTGWTRSYDQGTGQWHSRESYLLGTWRICNAFAAWNKIIMGDTQTGNLYQIANDTFTEDGGTMVMTITSPFLHIFPKGGVVDRASFDFLVGQGVTSPTAQGYDPIVMISKSIDGGNTWSYPREIKLGKQGIYQRRINTWRWGMFGPKGIAFRLSVSDPIGRALALCDLQVRPLAA